MSIGHIYRYIHIWKFKFKKSGKTFITTGSFESDSRTMGRAEALRRLGLNPNFSDIAHYGIVNEEGVLRFKRELTFDVYAKTPKHGKYKVVFRARKRLSTFNVEEKDV